MKFQVMYVTATSPYIFMLILLIRNLTLEGAGKGIEFYLKPNISKLAEMEVIVHGDVMHVFSGYLAV